VEEAKSAVDDEVRARQKLTSENRQLQASHTLSSIVREYIFYVFFNPKNATFYVFLKRHFKKRKKRNPKFEVSNLADFSLHEISTTAQKHCMFIIYIALVVAKKTRNLIGCGI